MLPDWLSPVQVNIIPVNNEYHLNYAKEIYDLLDKENIRVKLDDRNEKLSYKMRESQTKKVPYTLILGDNEKSTDTITVRLHGTNENINIDKFEFVNKIKEVIKNKNIKYDL